MHTVSGSWYIVYEDFYTSVRLFVYIDLFVYLCTSVRLFVYIRLSIYVHPSVNLYASVRQFVYICLSICIPEQSMYHCMHLSEKGRQT